jgi:hypothetical protein
VDEISRAVLERMRQGAASRAAEIADRVNPPATTADRIGAALTPGDRVFDTVTGASATVASAPIMSLGLQQQVTIRFADGSMSPRRVAQVIRRPTPPEARDDV